MLLNAELLTEDWFEDRIEQRREKVAKENHTTNPADAAEDVVEQEPAVFHLAHSGDHRGERPQERHKASQHDRNAAALLVKLLRRHQMIFAEKKRFFAREYAWP